MASVYVSGPVSRDGGTELPFWVRATYGEAYQRIGSLHAEALMPHSDNRLDKMDPREFYAEIERRISSADCAIAVFTSHDVSAGIEAAIASLHNKKLMIVTDKEEHVPRLLRGLPNVVSTVQYSDKQAVSGALTAFLQETLPGRARGTSASY